ncbi:hypothetical protein [Streptomyces sp. 35G-GA-8]|uniref:hypothetical protein n=1 Tax=Streptomyces sp. 35G-GA-8 TaxID=2939434 RepID=UPI00201F5F86|nr:hypothetical protein [Streptomyces sp. 35G-GA-8]MCL7376020.1 hypothetical protein [Streptomyces sp. 35G-GA-8]
MRRTTVVRWTGWTAGVLVLGLLAAWIWWRESDTAARWRFDDAMETFCGGVLAYEKSSLFEGLGPYAKLRNDNALGPNAHFCLLGEELTEVTVALLPADAEDDRNMDLERILPPFDGSMLPVPLTGGWRGAADGDSIRVLLSCRDDEDLVSVTVGSYTSEERLEQETGWLDSDLYWGRFAAATAVKASAHWGCEAEGGKALRALPARSGPESIAGADGTCAGLPFARDQRLDTVEETVTSSNSLYEICEVGASHYFSDTYFFSAGFGPYALPTGDRDTLSTRAEAGANGRGLWASARCPGDAERARFTGIVPREAATVWLPGEKGEETFGLPAFREFAERSAKRHNCTDLRLPTGE